MNDQLESQITKMSLKELVEVNNLVSSLITEKQTEARDDLLTEFEKMAQAVGLSLGDVVKDIASDILPGMPPETRPESEASKPPRKRASPKPQYRNPEDESLTWSGRGRKPIWIADYLKARDWQELPKDPEPSEEAKKSNKEAMKAILKAIRIEDS